MFLPFLPSLPQKSPRRTIFFNHLYTNSTETTGSQKERVLSRNFLHNSVLVNSRAIDRVGKTQNWEDREFDELTASEKIRFYAKKEVKKARRGIDDKEFFDIEELRRLEKEYLEGLKGKKIMLLGEKKRRY